MSTPSPMESANPEMFGTQAFLNLDIHVIGRLPVGQQLQVLRNTKDASLGHRMQETTVKGSHGKTKPRLRIFLHPSDREAQGVVFGASTRRIHEVTLQMLRPLTDDQEVRIQA